MSLYKKTLYEKLSEYEATLIAIAYTDKKTKVATAEELGIKRTTLHEKITRLKNGGYLDAQLKVV